MAASTLAHSFAASMILLTVLWPKSTKRTVDLTVYETPTQAPAPLQIAPKPPEPKKNIKKPRAVFGASRNAIKSEDTAAPEIKAGNTVAKAPDNDKLRPEDADALPIPTEEYLVTAMPQLISDFRVPYPAEAKSKGIQGAVVFDLLIDATGKVRESTLVEGPGAGLNEAAAEAVKRIQFKPAMVEDQPVAVRIRYAYRFVLER